MIVVASHNSQQNLERLFDSFGRHGTDGADVLISISIGSTPEFIEWAKETAIGEGFNWILEPCNGFETGAWIAAYRQVYDDTYLFLQDSMEVTAPGWYRQFVNQGAEARRKGYAEWCVPWVTFQPYLLGVTPPVRQRIIETYGLYGNPEFGIFGSMFYCNRAALERVDRAGYMNYIPEDKVGAEACERFWALYFQRLGIPMMALHADGFPHIHRGGHHPFLTKHFHHNPGAARR